MTLRDVAIMLHAGIERERAQWRHTATVAAAANAIMNENPKAPDELIPWAFGKEPKPSGKTPEQILSML